MPAALDQLARTSAPVPLADAVALSGFLDLVPDPRGVRGRRRYRLSALVAAAARVSWPVPARSPRSRNGSAMSPRGPAGFSASPPTRSSGPCPSRTPTPCAVYSSSSMATPWTGPSAPSSPPAPPRPAPDCWRSLSTARPSVACAPPRPRTSRCSPQWTTRSRPRPAPGRRQKQRDPRLQAPAGHHRPDRHGHHRRRPAHPARPRHLPPRTRRPLHSPGQGQTPACSTASATCPGARSRSTTTTGPEPTTAWKSGG
jgi:hypothetical protein